MAACAVRIANPRFRAEVFCLNDNGIRRGNDRHIGVVGVAEFAVVEAVAAAITMPDKVEAVRRPESLRRDDILAPIRRFAALGIAGVVTRPAENGKTQRAHFVAVNFALTPSPAWRGRVGVHIPL